MNKNLVIVLISYLLVVSCGNEKGNQEASEVVEKETAQQKPVPEIIDVNDVSEHLTEWKEWVEFNEEMFKFQKLKADNLSLSLDELVRLIGELDKSEFPEKINIPAIKSRLLVLKTFIYKTRSISDDREAYAELNDLQIKVVKAYNDLKSQIRETYREKEYEKVLQTIDSINNEIEQNKNGQNN